ncbi:MAG: hypothetical protein ACFB4J_10160 [Elainellaceae cyanobacterium]
MGKPQYWMPLLLCIGGAAAGLAAGYWGMVLATAPQSSEPTFAEELLGHEQAFPPSDNWPGSTARVAQDVLFEDPNQDWATGPSVAPLNPPQTWSSTAEAELDRESESSSSGVIENAAVASDAEEEPNGALGEDLVWSDDHTLTIQNPAAIQDAAADEAEFADSVGTAEVAEPALPTEDALGGGAKENTDERWTPGAVILGGAEGDRGPIY